LSVFGAQTRGEHSVIENFMDLKRGGKWIVEWSKGAMGGGQRNGGSTINALLGKTEKSRPLKW